MKYYYSTDGSPSQGPVEIAELQRLNDIGVIGPRTLVVGEGGEVEWRRLEEVIPSKATPPAMPKSSPPAIVPHADMLPQKKGRQYKVVVLTTGCFTGTMDPFKLQNTLNAHAVDGWKFSKSIHEEQKILGIFSREAHFLIFERSV